MPDKKRSIWSFDSKQLTWPFIIGFPLIALSLGAFGLWTLQFTQQQILWPTIVITGVLAFGFYFFLNRLFFRQLSFWILSRALILLHVTYWFYLLTQVHLDGYDGSAFFKRNAHLGENWAIDRGGGGNFFLILEFAILAFITLLWIPGYRKVKAQAQERQSISSKAVRFQPIIFSLFLLV